MRIPIFASCLALCAAAAPASVWANDCKPAASAVRAAVQAGDAAQARSLIGAVQDACPSKLARIMRGGLGQMHARIVRAERAGGGDLTTLRAKLLDWARFGDHWEVQQELANIAEAQGDYAETAVRLGQALDLIDDPSATPRAPQPAVIQEIHLRQSEAMSLAPKVVATVKRGGEPTAYHRRSIRGVGVPVKRPQIRFVTAQTTLTDQGAAALEELIKILRRIKPQSVVIAGHADRRGGDRYNLDLSMRRMTAVKAALAEQGVPVAARYACGDRILPELTDPERYSQEQAWEIARRVEVFYDVSDVPSDVKEICVAQED